MMPVRGNRNTALTLALSVLYALVACLFGAFAWPGLEWATAGFGAIVLASALRAWGEYKYVVSQDEADLLKRERSG